VLAAVGLLRHSRKPVPIQFATGRDCGSIGGIYDPTGSDALNSNVARSARSEGIITILINGSSGLDRDEILVHEALHALHFHRFRSLRTVVTEVHGYQAAYDAAQNPRSPLHASARRKLMALAWTEYWAYRRVEEYKQMAWPNYYGQSPDQIGRRWHVGRCLVLLSQCYRLNFNPARYEHWDAAIHELGR
jgi:hypothetical protein